MSVMACQSYQCLRLQLDAGGVDVSKTYSSGNLRRWSCNSEASQQARGEDELGVHGEAGLSRMEWDMGWNEG